VNICADKVNLLVSFRAPFFALGFGSQANRIYPTPKLETDCQLFNKNAALLAPRFFVFAQSR
jgi:hypothetical protein